MNILLSDEEALLRGMLDALAAINGEDGYFNDLGRRVYTSMAAAFDAPVPSAAISAVDITQEGLARELSVTVIGVAESSAMDRGLWAGLSLLDDIVLALARWDLSKIILDSGGTASMIPGSGSVSETDVTGSTVRSVEQIVTFSYPSVKTRSNC